MFKIRKYIILSIVLSLILTQVPASQTYAIQKDILDSVKKSKEPIIVKGNKVEYFHEEKKVTGHGGVSVDYGETELRCDKIVVYMDTKEAICEGNVKISQEGMSMEGEKIHYNFATKRGYAIDSKIKAKPLYGQAERVEQKGDKEFELEKGYVTTCDLEKPHYRVQAKEVRIFLDDKVVARNIRLYVGNLPVLFMPYYVQPLWEERPEVTIVPGRTSDWGYYALTAWRYYLNENAKGNIHIDYREKKGFGEGFDYKYNTKELGTGVARFYYAHENDDFAIDPSGSKDDRWRIQFMHNLELPEDTYLTMEYNQLSDRNIIKDYFYREYEEDPNPDNYILVETRKPNYIINVLTRKRMNNFFTVVERLPELNLEINNQRLWDTNFYYFSKNSMTNFVKRYDNDTNQSREESVRMDNYYKLSYAAKLFNFLYATPFMATRQTFYSQNRWKVKSQLRSLYEEGIDLSTKFYNIFDVNSNILGLDLNRLRHVVTPTVGYLFRHQPTISPDNLYQFDEIDDIEYHNGFDFSLENKLQTKRSENGDMKTVDLATFIVSTNYDFRLKKGGFRPKGVGKFGDIRFDLEVNPYPGLSIDSNMTLDSKDNDLNSANIDVYIDMSKDFSLGLGQRYEATDAGKTNQLTGELFYRINDEWKVKVYQRFDFSNEKWEEQEYTVFKDLHCWEAEVTFNKRGDEYTTWLVFRLKAFPKIPIGLFRTTYQRARPGIQR
ncbi:MAG: LPS-assembly protein LptD [Candidatus Omnitrophica bacterium]|nr:LPS-assembly protein LptD [Candidatus Omnitrophota bacterium]